MPKNIKNNPRLILNQIKYLMGNIIFIIKFSKRYTTIFFKKSVFIGLLHTW